MAFYEVVACQRGTGQKPTYAASDNIADAKELRDLMFRRDEFTFVFIRQYVAGGERYRILHTQSRRK